MDDLRKLLIFRAYFRGSNILRVWFRTHNNVIKTAHSGLVAIFLTFDSEFTYYVLPSVVDYENAGATAAERTGADATVVTRSGEKPKHGLSERTCRKAEGLPRELLSTDCTTEILLYVSL